LKKNCAEIITIIEYLIMGILIATQTEKYIGMPKSILTINLTFLFNFCFALISWISADAISNIENKLSNERNIILAALSIFFCSLIHFPAFICLAPFIGLKILAYYPPFFIYKFDFLKSIIYSIKIILCMLTGFSLINEHIMLFSENLILILFFCGAAVCICSLIFKIHFPKISEWLEKKYTAIKFFEAAIVAAVIFIFKFSYSLKIKI